MRRGKEMNKKLGSSIFTGVGVFLVAAFLSACSSEPKSGDVYTETFPELRENAGQITEERAVAAEEDSDSWLLHGRTYSEQRYSPLNEIDTASVEHLALGYTWDTGLLRGHEASPIVVDGVLYTTTPWSIVMAHEARGGQLLWQYDPQVPKSWGINACCDVVNRGVAVWEGKVYIGTLDGYLVAIDANSGEEIWRVLTVDRERPYTITGAPRIVKGKVIIGNGGAELGVRGYISAYDADSGDMLWRFHTVPGNPADGFESEAMRMAAETWSGGKWWEIGGGGTVWDSMAYDPDLDLLYIGTGNGSPWNRYVRSPGGGDNLFLSSIVALNPDTGEYIWHYQTTPGDNWDYTATQHIILADLEIQGRERKVLMQAPKNGYFYVIDRVTGEFISAGQYVKNLTWALGVDPQTGRPIENPETNYKDSTKLVFPSPYGGHNWQPMAFSPETGLVYIPTQELPFAYNNDAKGFEFKKGHWNLGIGVPATLPSKDPDVLRYLQETIKGYLVAWDPVKQEEVWRVEHPTPWNGGVLVTGGNLVFQGTGSGLFAAYRADTGEKVWEVDAQGGIIAPPITYSVENEQKIAIMVGYGGAGATTSGLPARSSSWPSGRLMIYEILGTALLPALPPPPGPPNPPTNIVPTPNLVAKGELLFHEAGCNYCHGAGAVSATPGLPDLRYMSATTHERFSEIVLEGTLADRGMVAFDDILNKEDIEYIRIYLIQQALDARAAMEAAGGSPSG